MRFSNLIRSKAVSRSCVVLAAAAMSMSLAACGGGDKSTSAAKEEPKVLEKIDEDTFLALANKKLGPVEHAKLYNGFNETTMQEIKEARDLFAELSPNLTITPEKCQPLARLTVTPYSPVEDYKSTLIAGTDDTNNFHDLILFLKPSETTIKEYESTTQELIKSCPEMTSSVPGRNGVTVKITPIDPGTYKQVKHIVGYQVEEVATQDRIAIIEAILENGQLVQIQDSSPENAVNILKDAFKHLQIS